LHLDFLFFTFIKFFNPKRRFYIIFYFFGVFNHFEIVVLLGRLGLLDRLEWFRVFWRTGTFVKIVGLAFLAVSLLLFLSILEVLKYINFSNRWLNCINNLIDTFILVQVRSDIANVLLNVFNLLNQIKLVLLSQLI